MNGIMIVYVQDLLVLMLAPFRVVSAMLVDVYRAVITAVPQDAAATGMRRTVLGVAAAGFTLIELLVVVAIIGLLASVIMASLNGARAKAKDARRVADMHEIRQALEVYNNDNGGYPNTSNAWRSQCAAWGGYAADQVIPGLVPQYIPSLPRDPDMSGNTCCYLYRSTGSNFKLLDYNCSSHNLASTKAPLDPARDGGSDTCRVDGTINTTWAVYTPGACTW